MTDPRNHLPVDLAALRYLDAITAGDLQTVANLWEAASRDPRLEQSLAEIDAALIAGAPIDNARLRSDQLHGGKPLEGHLLNGRRPSPIRARVAPRRARHWPVRAAALGALAAACWLMVMMRAKRDEAPRPDRHQAAVARRANARPVIDPTIRPTDASHAPSADLSAWRQTRRALRGEPPPPFAWPLRNTLTMSFPSDLLD